MSIEKEGYPQGDDGDTPDRRREMIIASGFMAMSSCEQPHAMLARSALICLVAFPILLVIIPIEEIKAVIGIAWILVVVPLCILCYIDWYKKRAGSPIKPSALASAPIFLLGYTCMLTGLGIVGGVACMLFYEPSALHVGSLGIPIALVSVGYAFIKLGRGHPGQGGKVGEAVPLDPRTGVMGAGADGLKAE